MGNLALLIGNGLQMGAQLGKGQMIKDASNFEAAGYKRVAAQERAAGQRSMFEEQNKTATVLSSQRAIAAASGGGADSPTILDIMGDTAQRGKYLADMEYYKGEERAKDALDKASAAKLRGKQAYIGSILEGISTGVKGKYEAKKFGLYG